jgi:choline transport protein
MSTLGWLASNASSVFVVTTMIEVAINITNPSFTFPNWQYTLIMLAFVTVTILFNTWGATVLPALEIASLGLHTIGWFIFIIALWVTCPRNSAHDVFTVFTNGGGWSDIGTACLISQVSVIYCNLGMSMNLLGI